MKSLYLDDTATMRVWPEVVNVMNKMHRETYGNPSSLHAAGEEALRRITTARTELAGVIHAKPEEVYFTSGGSEANTWALLGLASAHPTKKKVIVSAIEHASIIEPCTYLAHCGLEIVKVPVDEKGIIDLKALAKAIGDGKDVLVVSIMHANNVVGSIQPLRDVAALCKQKKVLYHTDACQTFGKLRIDVTKMHIDLLSASAHKLGGPKGTGLLYTRNGVKLHPLIIGGGQEKGMRSGTQNSAGIVGFSKAIAVFQKRVDRINVQNVRDYCMHKLKALGGTINGSRESRLYNHIHVSFPKVESDTLVVYLSEKGFYVSSGSACDSQKSHKDHVLSAMGVNQKHMGSIRITLGYQTTKKDIDALCATLKKTLAVLRL